MIYLYSFKLKDGLLVHGIGADIQTAMVSANVDAHEVKRALSVSDAPYDTIAENVEYAARKRQEKSVRLAKAKRKGEKE